MNKQHNIASGLEQSKEELPEVLYHYCSWETFENIIKHRTIRFSDVMKSNDTQEIFYLFEKYLERQGGKKKDISNGMFECGLKKDFNGQTYYTFCLSKAKDLLSQWRGYAPNGGVSIGFSTEMLQKWSQSIEVLGEKAKVSSVKYVNCSEDIFKGKKIDFVHVNNYPFLLEMAPQYKNDGFKEEQEVRVFFKNYFELRDGADTLPTVLSGADPCTIGFCFTTAVGLKSYYDIPFNYNMIKEVIIGPKLNIEIKELDLLLRNSSEELYDYVKSGNVKIEKTKLSYR